MDLPFLMLALSVGGEIERIVHSKVTYGQDKAKELCELLDHPVSLDFASHVEKQLVAYYVYKHVLLPDECEELKKVKPPMQPVRATIVINKKEVCHCCRVFLNKVRERLGVDIEVKVLAKLS